MTGDTTSLAAALAAAAALTAEEGDATGATELLAAAMAPPAVWPFGLRKLTEDLLGELRSRLDPEDLAAAPAARPEPSAAGRTRRPPGWPRAGARGAGRRDLDRQRCTAVMGPQHAFVPVDASTGRLRGRRSWSRRGNRNGQSGIADSDVYVAGCALYRDRVPRRRLRVRANDPSGTPHGPGYDLARLMATRGLSTFDVAEGAQVLVEDVRRYLTQRVAPGSHEFVRLTAWVMHQNAMA